MILLAASAWALAACGVGFGPGEGSGQADLLVTRDFGTETLVKSESEELTESDTVMRLLDRNVEIETRYGGGFVQTIDGIDGGDVDGRPYDWFFFVNGIEADRGGADYALSDGDRVWWDFRDWGAAMRIPAVVGQFPQPFVSGYAGESWRTEVNCLGVEPACEEVVRKLVEAGARFEGEGESIRVLVGTWPQITGDDEGRRFGRGPQVSGVFLKAQPTAAGGSRQPVEFVALDGEGKEVGRYGAGYGLVAATRRGEGAPVWVVAGSDEAGVEAAADALDAETLQGRFALLVGPEGEIGLPVR